MRKDFFEVRLSNISLLEVVDNARYCTGAVAMSAANMIIAFLREINNDKTHNSEIFNTAVP
jgi:hypothetical protein